MEYPNAELAQLTKPASDAPAPVAPPPLELVPNNESPLGSTTANSDLEAANGSLAEPSSGINSPKSVRWSEQLIAESTFTASADSDASRSTSESAVSFKVKTSPSFTDAAMGRLAHSTKVIAEGGYEKIFRQTFETAQDELLKNSYACYLSTSAGPVMGALYLSTEKVAFCSDNPLPYKNGDQTEWSYYKVIIPLHQLKAFNASSSRMNASEKYIQIISTDNNEFWYMGFLSYENVVDSLQEALQASSLQSV